VACKDAVADRPKEPTSAGHLRVWSWFGGWAVISSLIFLYRLEHLQPDWLLLALLMSAPCVFGVPSFRELVHVKSQPTKEIWGQIGLAIGATLAAAALVYVAWRYDAPSAMRMMETYVIPALAPFSFILAALALHVERKHKVRVFIGNRGWLYLAMPSDNTAQRTRH
jgi:hypothetical protein